jgi:WD40 repeat protein
MTIPDDCVYDAFISYSHAEKDLASALQSGLQRFARPWNRLRALTVFRDDSDLAANPDLWESVRTAMDGSRYLIVLTSPSARESPWVNREVGYWLATRSAASVLIVAAAGESPAVIPALAEAYTAEPRHLDVRHLPPDQWTLRSPEFRSAVAELAAPLHGKPKSELESEDKRLFRRARRWRLSALAALCLLTAAAAVAGMVASVSIDRARDAFAEAHDSREIANAEQRRAEQESAEADRATLRAQAEEARAARATREATRQTTLARTFRTRADTARKEAARQLKIAQEQEAAARAATTEATRQKQLAKTAAAEAVETRRRAEREAATAAVSRTLADLSRTRAPDLRQARLLAVAAYKVAPTPEARGALLSTWHDPVLKTVTGIPFGGFVTAEHVAYDDDNRMIHNIVTDVNPVVPAEFTDGLRRVLGTPDGRFVVAVHEGTIGLWGAKTLVRLRGVPREVTGGELLVAPDGRGFGYWDREAFWWDTRTGRFSRISRQQIAAGAGDAPAIDVTSRGRLFAVKSTGHVVTWDVATGKRHDTGVRLAGFAGGLAVSPDGHLATGDTDDGRLGVWNLASGELIADTVSVDEPGDDRSPRRFSPDGGTVAIATSERIILLWEFRNGSIRRLAPSIENGGAIQRLEFSPDGRRLMTSSKRDFRIWNVSRPLLNLSGELSTPADLVLGPDRRRLLVTDSDGGVAVYDVASGAVLGRYPAARGSALSSSVAYSASRQLALVGARGVRIFRLGESARPAGYLGASRRRVDAVALSADGTTAAVARGVEVVIYDMRRQVPVGRLSKTRAPVRSLSMSPDGRRLVVAEGDPTFPIAEGAALWDLTDPRHPVRLRTQQPPDDLRTYSPDGSRYLLHSLGSLQMHRSSDDRRLALLGGVGLPRALAFTERGRTLVASTETWDTQVQPPTSASLEFFDVGTLQRFASITDGRIGVSYGMDVDPDEGVVAVVSDDGAVTLWWTDPDRIAAGVCRLYGGPLTRHEWRQLLPGMPYFDACKLRQRPVDRGVAQLLQVPG